MSLDDQLQALESLAGNASGFLSESQRASASALATTARQRQTLARGYTVVGLLGSTGSGKSSLFNALVGETVAQVGVLRPTTTGVTAAVWGQKPPEELLGWLNVDTHWNTRGEDVEPTILLDLPDFDSVDDTNRAKAEQLAGQVDVLIWVTDPQKYADRRLHADFLGPLAHQDAVTVVVLNQSDRLSQPDLELVVSSLKGLLARDGLGNCPLVVSSAATGTGVADLQAQITAVTRERFAARKRWEADVAAWGAANLPDTEPNTAPLRQADRKVKSQLAQALGTETIGQTIAESYLHRARSKTGWLPLAWLTRFRADPLRRIGITPSSNKSVQAKVGGSRRTSISYSADSVQAAAVSLAIRDYCLAAADTVPGQWASPFTDRIKTIESSFLDGYDRSLPDVSVSVSDSRWWSLGRFFQWIGLLAILAGFAWYLVVWAASALRFPEVPIATVEGWPVPAILIATGLLFGLLMVALFGGLARIFARRKKNSVVRTLNRGVSDLAEELIIEPFSELRQKALVTFEEIEATTFTGRS